MTVYDDASTQEAVETQASIGDALRTARAARGLSVADVEADLRIKAYYIEAIEAGDRAALPDKVYVDGFVRNYASYLQLNADDVLSRFDRETGVGQDDTRKGFGRTKPAAASTTNARNPLAGYTPPRRSDATGGGIGQSLISLWPLLVLAGLGYAIWYGVIAAREAGIIPDNISVISATDAEPPVFTANISDQSINGTDGDSTIERPADLSYAEIGKPPYWTLSEDNDRADGPVSTIDVASVGLFAAHRDVMGGSALVRNATPLDLAPAPSSGILAEIAAETRAALMTRPAAPVDIASDDAVISGRDLALIALEETWIEIRSPSGGIRFSGILAPNEAYDLPAGDGYVLKVGNAGGLVAEVSGERLGPFGNRGAVMRNIALDRDALSQRLTP